MADWYVSSTAWAAIPIWAASTVYTVGQIIRPTAPAFTLVYSYRCTTAGTSGTTEPNWAGAIGNNFTIASGTATFTNVTGQSTYGWAAAGGNLWDITGSNSSTRLVAGDRVFISSDHVEANTGASGNANYSLNNASTLFGNISVISVNRAGSVPPTAVDYLAGANINYTGSANMNTDSTCNQYWQGITFTIGGACSGFSFTVSGTKNNYYKNCAFVITSSTTTLALSSGIPTKVTLDNTTVTFNAVGQRFNTSGFTIEIVWINTPTALLGTIPTNLFQATNSGPMAVTARGTDFSALTTTLFYGGASYSPGKFLLDSCRIASGLIRLSTTSYNCANDEIELVNCFNGTSFLAERHTPAGDVTTEFSTTMVGGAQDDVGLFSHKLASSPRCDPWTMTLDSFWLDVENRAIGASRTATVELVASLALNNTDINLILEYQGTTGSSLATFGFSLASPLAASAALPLSTAVWGNLPQTTWNPADLSNVTLSNGNLTATVTGSGGVRASVGLSAGKYYFEYTMSTWVQGSAGPGLSLASTALSGGVASAGLVGVNQSNGQIWINGSPVGTPLGVGSNGTIVGIAVDFGAQLVWCRYAPAGNWNGSGTANPATGTGGLSISTLLPGTLYPRHGANGSGDVATANFGGSAFSGTVPSGFTSGIPVVSVPQRLQVAFTPLVLGRVRGLVRLGRPSTTVFINPVVMIS